MFERIHPEGKFEGTGIGLTIVRKAVEKMGGALTLESEPGRGARIIAHVPLRVQAEVTSQLKQDELSLEEAV